MPPLPVIADVWRCTFNWTTGTPVYDVHNIMHVLDTTADPGVVGGNFDSVITAHIPGDYNPFALMHEDWVMNSMTFQLLDGVSAGVTLPITDPMTGTGTGDAILEACAIVSHYTTQRGPRGRGRTYIGPVGEQSQDAGTIVPLSAVTDTTNYWAAFVTDLAGAGAIPVVASYEHSDYNTIENNVCKHYVATQRRRLTRTR